MGDNKKQVVEYENPVLLFSEKKISSGTTLVPLIEQCHSASRPLIIIAEDIDGEALSTLLLNRLRLNLRICAVKAPGFGDNRKNNLRDMGKLAGGVAVIRVGGSSEVEVNEKKDRMNDSLNATKAAVAEGIVPGGGVALLYATKVLEDLDSMDLDNDDQKVGVNIVRKAMYIPATAIINNSGKEGAVYCGKMLETATPDSRYGYDAATDSWQDLHELGVVDPAKVAICALQDSASVAGLMTTTECVITDFPKPASNTPQMDMGGPGGGF